MKRLLTDRVTQRLFAVYVTIGGFVFVCYVALFQYLIARGWPVQLCTTVAYFTASAIHFALNKYANFRRFDRALHDQARTFAVLTGTQWLLTLAIVTVLSAHGVKPIIATVIAVVVNVPLMFVANRYLTFGKGIRLAVHRMLKAPK